MSRALEIADQMALEAKVLPALSTSTVNVYRQQDVLSEIKVAVAKAMGSAVVITWEGFQRPEETIQLKGEAIRVVSTYLFRIFSAPVLKPGAITIDEIAEALILHFDDWNESHQPSNRDTWLRFRDAIPSVEDGYITYDLEFDKVIQFSAQP